MLNEQLERLQTDYIDFYLMHALDKDRFKNVVEKFNLIDKLNKAKADGKIRHIGFSFHDDVETLKKIIDANPNWEFCQIQLNYINVKYQAGLEGLEYAHKKGLDVVIMEPLLGGKLANPSPQVAKEVFDKMALVPCTKCAYCMPCPFGLDIPKTFEAYNATASLGTDRAKAIYAELNKGADQCKKCKKCEKVCPQSIKISHTMTEIAKIFAK